MAAGAKRVEIISPVYSEISDDKVASLSSEDAIKIEYGGLEND